MNNIFSQSKTKQNEAVVLRVNLNEAIRSQDIYKNLLKKSDKNKRQFAKYFLGKFSNVSLAYLPTEKIWIVFYSDIKGNLANYFTKHLPWNNSLVDVNLGRGELMGKEYDYEPHDVKLVICCRIIDKISVLTGFLKTRGENRHEEENEYFHLFDFPFINPDLVEEYGWINDSKILERDENLPDFAQQVVNVSKYKKDGIKIFF